MKTLIRFCIALAVCLSGWALAPVVDLPRVAFSWEQYADAYSLIHRSVIPAGAVALRELFSGRARGGLLTEPQMAAGAQIPGCISPARWQDSNTVCRRKVSG